MIPATTDQLADALDRAGRLIAGIRADQWANPTPCDEWDLRTLVAHLTNGNTLFATALGAETKPTSEYDASAETLLSAFRLPGVLERPVDVPFGRVPAAFALHLRITESLVHGWDIARATGQAPDFPDPLVEQEYQFSVAARAAVPPDRSPFGPTRPAPDTAPAIDRLAALLGRKLD